MSEFELRPLTLGEILDRTFTLYRKHFVLFFGIAALPQILVIAVQLFILFAKPVTQPPSANPLAGLTLTAAAFAVVSIIALCIASLFAHGGTIFAVSELYLGRQITITEALGRVRGNLGTLVSVGLLNGLAIVGAAIFFIIPGIYVACRLVTCIACALIEDKGPRDSLSRSFRLTKGFAGRTFMIYALYCAIAFAASMLTTVPLAALMLTARGNPGMVRMWTALAQVGGAMSGALVLPILMIAVVVFYYDLRVRKEAFDIQLMMNPELNPASPSDVPSIL